MERLHVYEYRKLYGDKYNYLRDSHILSLLSHEQELKDRDKVNQSDNDNLGGDRRLRNSRLCPIYKNISRHNKYLLDHIHMLNTT